MGRRQLTRCLNIIVLHLYNDFWYWACLTMTIWICPGRTTGYSAYTSHRRAQNRIYERLDFGKRTDSFITMLARQAFLTCQVSQWFSTFPWCDAFEKAFSRCTRQHKALAHRDFCSFCKVPIDLFSSKYIFENSFFKGIWCPFLWRPLSLNKTLSNLYLKN